ncbi:MAG: hypothetical protein C0478_02035 [Planctomyces sp.]|nr:hypothetical protein [Planctomyces sp.]
MLTKSNSYQLTLDGGQLVLKLLPGMTEAPWSEIEQAGFEAVSEVQKLSKPQVVVDLTELTYIGSSQVALVIRVWKAVKVQDGSMVVATANSTVREVLALSGLDRIWKLVDTSEEAKTALGRRDVEPDLPAEESPTSPLPAYALLAACFIGILGLVAFGVGATMPGRILLSVGGVLALIAGFWGLITTSGILRLFAGSGATAGIALLLIAVLLPQPSTGFRRNSEEAEAEAAVTGGKSPVGREASDPVPATSSVKTKEKPPAVPAAKLPPPSTPPTSVDPKGEAATPPAASLPAASPPAVTDPASVDPATTDPAGPITPRSTLKDL